MKTGRSTHSRISRAVLLALVMAGPASAELDPARARFEAAQTAFDLGEFEKARALYAEAYELKPLPGLLFNIGQCHKKLGEWNKAAFFYRRYLARVPEGTDVERLQELITEMDERDRATPAERPKPAAVRPESDVPRAQAPAPLPAVTAVSVLAPPPRKVSLEVATPPPVVVIEREDEPLYRRWWVWAGAGAATVATATAVAAVGFAASRPSTPRYGKLDAR